MGTRRYSVLMQRQRQDHSRFLLLGQLMRQGIPQHLTRMGCNEAFQALSKTGQTRVLRQDDVG